MFQLLSRLAPARVSVSVWGVSVREKHVSPRWLLGIRPSLFFQRDFHHIVRLVARPPCRLSSLWPQSVLTDWTRSLSDLPSICAIRAFARLRSTSSRSAKFSVGTVVTIPSGVTASTPWQAWARSFTSTDNARCEARSSSGITFSRNA